MYQAKNTLVAIFRSSAHEVAICFEMDILKLFKYLSQG